MSNWFSIINIENILILLAGFIVGRFWRLGKKLIAQINNQDKEQNNG